MCVRQGLAVLSQIMSPTAVRFTPTKKLSVKYADKPYAAATLEAACRLGLDCNIDFICSILLTLAQRPEVCNAYPSINHKAEGQDGRAGHLPVVYECLGCQAYKSKICQSGSVRCLIEGDL